LRRRFQDPLKWAWQWVVGTIALMAAIIGIWKALELTTSELLSGLTLVGIALIVLTQRKAMFSILEELRGIREVLQEHRNRPANLSSRNYRTPQKTTPPEERPSGSGAVCGAIIGGVIGTLLIPGIGTIIGALLGAIVGNQAEYEEIQRRTGRRR